MPGKGVRAEFSETEDIFLMKFIATYNPAKQGRGGNTLYQRLVDNVDGKWNWSESHSWQSWRNRYAKQSDEFDRKILRYQKKKGIDPEVKTQKKRNQASGQDETIRVRSEDTGRGTKRAGDQLSSSQRKAKRTKLEASKPDDGRSSLPPVEAAPTSPIPAAGPSSKPHKPLPVQEQPGTMFDMPLPTQEPEINLNIPPLPARPDTLFPPSSQSDSPVRSQPPTTSQLRPISERLASSSQRVATPEPPSLGPKLNLKKKRKLVSPPFRSLSPTPNHPTPPKKKILPKVVDGHFTTSLTDRLGHVRQGDRSESEEETEAWPPVRRKKGKEKDVILAPTAVISSTVQEDKHHPTTRVETAISRSALALPKREPEDQQAPTLLRLEPEHHPFSQVPFPPPQHNRAGADVAESPLKHRSTNGVHRLVQDLRDGKRGSDTTPSTSSIPAVLPLVQPAVGTSKLTATDVPSGSTSSAELPPKPVVIAPDAPPISKENTRLSGASTGPASSEITQQAQVPTEGGYISTTDVYPTVPLHERNSHPAASSRKHNIEPPAERSSPFLPSIQRQDKGKAKRRDTEPPLTHAERLLAGARKQRRRQTLWSYKNDDVPSIDLTHAPSAASTFRNPRSKANASASVSRLPEHYSFPAHSTPSAIPVVPADLSGYLTTLDQPAPTILPVPPALIMATDIPLSASIGFSTLISRIAAAHGYAPSVVLEVYKRLGSLKDAEEFVRAMRNATEEWVGAEFERREREARRASRRQNKSDSSESSDGAPRGHNGRSCKRAPAEHWTPNGLHVQYVPPDESEYEPPPTSRAARWKRASMTGVGSRSTSWGTIPNERRRTKEDEITEHRTEEVEDTVDSSDDDSGEEDEESQDDLERAEEETVAEELIPDSAPDQLQDEDVIMFSPKQDTERAPEHEEHSNQDNHQGPYQHHEFSRTHQATHMKRESRTPPRLHRNPEHVPALNGVEVLNGDLSNIPLTRSASHPWNADEDGALLSADWEILKTLEKQRGMIGMRRRIVQLLR